MCRLKLSRDDHRNSGTSLGDMNGVVVLWQFCNMTCTGSGLRQGLVVSAEILKCGQRLVL